MKNNCKDCVFCQYEQGRQSGCELDRDVDVIGVTPENHFVLARKCQAKRNADWKLQNTDWEEKIGEELRAKSDLIILVTDYDKSQLKRTLETANQFEKVIVVVNDKSLLSEITNTIVFSVDIPYRITFTTYKGADRKINEAFKRVTSPFYTLCDAGYEFPESYMSDIDNALNIQLKSFVAAFPDEGINGMTVNRDAHKLLHGNDANASIKEKLLLVAHYKNELDVIWRYDDGEFTQGVYHYCQS